MRDIKEIVRPPPKDDSPTDEWARDFQKDMMRRYQPAVLPRVVLARLSPDGMNFVADKRDILERIRSGISPLQALDDLRISLPSKVVYNAVVMAMLDGYLGIDLVGRFPEADLVECIKEAMTVASQPVVSMAVGVNLDLVNGTINTPRQKVLDDFLYANRSTVESLFGSELKPLQREHFDAAMNRRSKSGSDTQNVSLLDLGPPTSRKLPPFVRRNTVAELAPEMTPESSVASVSTSDDVEIPNGPDVPFVGNAPNEVQADVGTGHEEEGIVEAVTQSPSDTIDAPVVEPGDDEVAESGEQAEVLVSNMPEGPADAVVPASRRSVHAGVFSVRTSDGRSYTFEGIGDGQEGIRSIATIVQATMGDAQTLSIEVADQGAVARSAYLAFLFAAAIGKSIHVVVDGATLVANPFPIASNATVQEAIS